MTDRELMQQALEALEKAHHAMQTHIAQDQVEEAIIALRERLAQPNSVKLPTTADEAELMVKAGLMWLEQNAPDRMAQPEQEPAWRTPGGIPRFKPKQPTQPYAKDAAYLEGATNGRMRIDPVTGDVSVGKQPEQEPYAWMAIGGSIWRHKTTEDDVPLYTAPPRREWLGLTEEEVVQTLGNVRERLDGNVFGGFARAIEAKLREKNR